MRALEVVIGSLALLAGMTGHPLDLGGGDPAENGPVEGELGFAIANYTGPAEVHTDRGALWSKGQLSAAIQADRVTVHRYEWEGARGEATVGHGGSEVYAFYSQGRINHSSTVYHNASIEVDSPEEGLVSIRSDGDIGPSQFTLPLDKRDPPRIIASKTGPVLWGNWAGFDHHIEGPVFAYGNDGVHDDVWTEQARFDRLDARGSLNVTVLGGPVQIDAREGERTLETGREDVEQETGLASATETTKRVHAVLVLENAKLSTTFDRPGGVFFAKEPTWNVDGSLQVHASEGRLETGGQNASLTNDTVRLRGTTTLDLAAHGPPGSPNDFQTEKFTPDRPTPPIRGTMESQAESLSVNGQPLPTREQTSGSEEVSLAAKILGLLVLAFSALKQVPALLVSLLTEDPLANDRRQRIYSFLQEVGMAYPREVERALGIPVSSASHHLRVLCRENLLTRVDEGGYTVYFPCTEFELEEKERLALLACPTRKTIADVLVEEGAYSQTGLLEAVEVDRSTVSKHLAKLAEADLVEVEDAETIQYSPSDLLRDWAEKHRSSPS